MLKIPEETFSLYGPHSLLSRLIYDFGFVGTLFWIFIVISGMYQLRKFNSEKNYNILLFVYIMLISISIAHKSHLIMIALGVTMILSNLYSNDEYEDLSSKPKLLARKF